MSKDEESIELLGGSAKLARRLGYTVQRVQNWKERGIPAKVKLEHPELFQLSTPNFGRRATDEHPNNQALSTPITHNHRG